ncbi:MAG TPA: tetratricopeptide repeat protein [Bacillales bacterium]|nr:tetratricopeptide repeat protein [Bacillales bacterium]
MRAAIENQQYQKVQQLIEWRRYDEAIKEAQEWIQQDVENPDGYAYLAQCYLRKKEYQKSLHWTEQALGKNPVHSLAWQVKVSVHYEQRNWTSFREAVDEGLRINPYEDFYYYLRGNLFNLKGEFEQAEKDFEKCLEISPENAVYLANYGYVQSLLHHFDYSREIQEKTLQLDPENPTVFKYLAWAAEKRGAYKEALNFMANAIRIDPEDQQTRKEYLKVLQKQYRIYQWILFVPRQLNLLKKWQVFIVWGICWAFLKILVIFFIALFVASHWFTKLLVHVKVFGWRLPPKNR